MDPVQRYYARGANSASHSMDMECYLQTASMMQRLQPMIRITAGNDQTGQDAAYNAVDDKRALDIAKLILAEQKEALLEFSTNLDDIELGLGDKRAFLLILPKWTKVFPDWRNHLIHAEEHLAYLHHTLSGRPAASLPASRREFAEAIALAQRLQSAVVSYRARLEMTCQVISILTGVVSADRSLQEADGVSKLSHLAFFFVPLGLVAAFFSMDIAVSICQTPRDRLYVIIQAYTFLWPLGIPRQQYPGVGCGLSCKPFYRLSPTIWPQNMAILQYTCIQSAVHVSL